MLGVFMSRAVSPYILKGPPNYHDEGQGLTLFVWLSLRSTNWMETKDRSSLILIDLDNE